MGRGTKRPELGAQGLGLLDILFYNQLLLQAQQIFKNRSKAIAEHSD